MEPKVIFEGYFPDLEGRFRVKLYEDHYWVQFHEGGDPLKDDNWTNVHNDINAERKVIKKALEFFTQVHSKDNCNFCGKSQKEVKKLVASALNTRICDECVTVTFAVMIESPVKFQRPKDSIGPISPTPTTPEDLQSDPRITKEMVEDATIKALRQKSDWCPTCKQGWDCAKHDQESRIKLNRVARALEPLKRIADAYDENNLDDEARKKWGENYEHKNVMSPEKIELYSGRGGTQLLTLEHCFIAREVLKS